MDETPRHAVDELVRDGVQSQRDQGIMPEPEKIRAFVQGIVERADRQADERRLKVFPKKEKVERPRVERSTEAMETEFQKRLKRKGQEALPGSTSWTIERTPTVLKPENPQIVSKRMALAKRRMRQRLRLLRSKPEWEARLKTINPLALQGHLGEDKQKHATLLVQEVIKDSERVFGPWWKAAPKKLVFDQR